jgi:ABC-type molybdenum transport system ATPase subunit/photorepair protein PhrA
VWSQVVKAVDKKKKRLELQKRLEVEADKLSTEEKEKINKQIEDLNVVEQVVEYPRKVDSEVMLHVAIVGPNKSGRTSIAQALKKEHKRAIVNMNELLEWNINSGTSAGAKATEFL